MRRVVPEQFHCLVKMHLSFLLDLTTDDCNCSFLYEHPPDVLSTPSSSRKKGIFPATPKRKGSNHGSHGTSKGVMEGAPLTMEGVCQVFQIIEYLKRPANLKMEGLFRKHGNLKKQQTLKERLNKGIPVDLDSGDFSVHECASTLKTFLSDLVEPLLTDAYYRAHCQVASLTGGDAISKKIQCLQLLFLLIPEPNYALLKDILLMLYAVTGFVDSNKMDADNLATVFATHIMCPKKLAPDCLQSNHQLYIKAVSFMIDNTNELFDVPPQLAKDADVFWKSNNEKECVALRGLSGPTNSPVVNTVYSFVDREKTKEAALKSTTETALAELYAQVQAMPESAHKKRLIGKLNDANGHGTPASSKKRSRAEAPSRIMSLLTPKSKSSIKKPKKEGRNHGSYSLSQPFHNPEVLSTPLSTFKRHDSRNESQCPSDAATSPSLAKPLKPAPPPRISSLKKTRSTEGMTAQDLLHTPRCRKPLLVLSPSIESPAIDSGSTSGSDISHDNVSVSSSVISNEAHLLLTGGMNPSDSMTYFLDGQHEDPACTSPENKNPNQAVFSPSPRKAARKRSITELGGPNPLAKTPTQNRDVYFETDL
jgi:hypothetical protein